MNASPRPSPQQPVRVYPTRNDPRIEIVDPPGDWPAQRASLAAETERVWLDECRANPGLYDGSILGVVSLDAQRGLVTCCRDSYKHLVAAQHGLPTNARSLGVKGVLIARNEHGVDRVLVGTRGPNVRMYPRLDEFAPAGGVRPPQNAGTRSMNVHDLHAELLNEAQEELAGTGIDVAALVNRPAHVLGLCEDDTAQSLDVVIRVSVAPESHRPSLGASPAADTLPTWEYANTRWLPLTDLIRDLERSPERYSPPTRIIATGLLSYETRV